MGEKRDYEILLFATVVRDIGKFWQGTGERKKHQELAGQFVKIHFSEKWQEVLWIA